MTLDQDALETFDLPDASTARSSSTAWRYRLIHWLARGDLVCLNTETIAPVGWAVSVKHPGQGVFYANNDIRLDEPIPLPMAMVIGRGPFGRYFDDDE